MFLFSIYQCPDLFNLPLTDLSEKSRKGNPPKKLEMIAENSSCSKPPGMF